MSEIYFEDVLDIGNLYLEKVFNKFEDENITFICSDISENRYFCLCYEFRHAIKWIISKITPEILVKLITKKIDMKSVFQMNEKLIHIVYMNDKEVAEEVFYHDLDESVFPKAGINLKVNEKQDIRHYLYFICFFLMTTESFKYEERYIYQLSSDLNTINKSSSYSMKTYTVPYNLKNIIKNSKKEDISIEISCAA